MYIRSPELRYRLRYTPAADVALELGGVRSGNWYRCRCPGHGSQSLTLALCDGRDGLVIHCHAGCSRAKVAKALDDLGLLGPSAHQAHPEPIDPAEHQRRSIQHAARLWHHSLPVGDGDRISTYWRSRGLGRLPIPRTIRRSGGMLPDGDGKLRYAMIALVEH